MGNVKELKQQNILEAIRILHKEKEVSKQELARQMGISTVSAHSFINELLDKGIVLSSGTGSSSHGRKATLYRLNPRYGFAVGIVLTSASITTVTYNFTSELISSFSLGIEKIPDEALYENMIVQARLAIGNHEKEYGVCLGVGIAMPAIIDHKTGLIKRILHFPDFKTLDLKFVMQDELKVPVFIGNDNKVCMNAIKWAGDRNTDLPLAFIGVEEGVGCGVMIGGQILQGADSVAGEIGHLPIDLNGPLCSCGNRGCIEHYISEKGLIAKIIRHLNREAGNDFQYSIENFTIQHVISLASSNAFVRNAIRECCDYFCILLENVVKIYGPQEIIIECEYLKQLPEFFSYLSDRFYRSPWVSGQSYIIRLNTIESVYATGGAMTVLDNIYTNPTDNLLLDLLDDTSA